MTTDVFPIEPHISICSTQIPSSSHLTSTILTPYSAFPVVSIAYNIARTFEELGHTGVFVEGEIEASLGVELPMTAIGIYKQILRTYPSYIDG